MALDLRGRHGFAPAAVAGIDVEVDEVQHMLVDPLERKQAPAVAIDAKFSIPFTTALALTRGASASTISTPTRWPTRRCWPYRRWCGRVSRRRRPGSGAPAGRWASGSTMGRSWRRWCPMRWAARRARCRLRRSTRSLSIALPMPRCRVAGSGGTSGGRDPHAGSLRRRGQPVRVIVRKPLAGGGPAGLPRYRPCSEQRTDLRAALRLSG
jgi:hypothetical protein